MIVIPCNVAFSLKVQDENVNLTFSMSCVAGYFVYINKVLAIARLIQTAINNNIKYVNIT